MKKRLRNIPKNKFGAQDATNLLTGMGQLGMSVTQAAQNSAANGVNAGNTIGSMLGGAATGAQLGSMFGPIGTGVGAAVGGLASGIASLVGRKGSVDSITGEITKGSGIKGRRGPSYDELMRRSLDIRQNNAYREYNNTAAYDWYQDNGYNGYTLAADGGIIPNALAYVDDGELLRTPDGQIIDVPEEGKPTDSNLISVPEGTQVLSDKLKVPGTKQTFAEAGKKIMKKQNYGNDKYAKNSEMLNNMNNQIAYDNLLELQEDMKKRKNIKSKINKYDDGTRNIQSADDISWVNDIMPSQWYRSTLGMINADNLDQYNDLQNMYPTLGFTDTKPGNTIVPNNAVGRYQGMFDNLTDVNAAINDLYDNGRLTRIGNTGDSPEIWRDNLPGTATWLRNLGRNVSPQQLQYIQSNLNPYIEAYINPANGMVNFRRNARTVAPEISDELTDLSSLARVDTTIPKTDNANMNTNRIKNNKFNLSSTLNDLSPLISGLSSFVANSQNARNLEPEQVSPRYARAYFSPVEYNINPLLNDINRTHAITRYNQSQLSPNTGANLAYGIQSAVARNRAINEAYNNQRAINNQTRARNAATATSVSQFNAQAQHTSDVENAQDRAQARNLRRKYRSANAAIIPVMLRDIRQNRRDQALLEYMRPFLEYGSTSDAINRLYGGL